MTVKTKVILPNFSQLGNYIKGNTFRISLKNDINYFFECSDLFACILSDKISALKISDPTISEITVLHRSTLKYFKNFYNKMINCQELCSTLEIDFDNIEELKNYMEDIHGKICPSSIKEEKLTTANSVDLLQKFYTTTEFYQKIIDFIAKNFEEILNKDKLTVNELEQILNNENLQIKSESSLFNFIINYINQNLNEESKILLNYIEYQNLPIQDIEIFLHLIEFDDLNPYLWEKISKRLLLNISPSTNTIDHNQQKRYISSKISLKPIQITGTKLNGIIQYLTEKTGGNIHKNGTITISASSCQLSRHNPVNLCDFNDLSRYSMWSPANESDFGNLTFDFKERKVKLTDYSLHTPNNKTCDYPKSWEVLCSDDGKSWEMADLRENENSMNSSNRCGTFHCINQLDQPFQYLKIRPCGNSWGGNNHHFDIAAVEFFGVLFE